MPQRLVASRLGAGGRTVVPRAVREALGIAPGDEIGYVIEDGRVELVRLRSKGENPFAAFGEWDSEADREGYRPL
ncbi:MAG: transcriptional regulator [Proteobacteria bacterium]|nr:transcriptional regulator [Pseudomonadota bacterium]